MFTSQLGLATGLLCATLGASAFAQGATETVKFGLTVFQPSLFDSDQRDTFSGVIDDRSATTTLNIECSAGASAWLGLSRVDEACSTAGSGAIKNPSNPAQTLPRISYAGGFTIDADSDGFTDASTILANYLRAGSAGGREQPIWWQSGDEAGKPQRQRPRLGGQPVRKPQGNRDWNRDCRIFERDRLDPVRRFHCAACWRARAGILQLDRRCDFCLCQRSLADGV